MTELPVDPRLFGALTLGERVALLREAGPGAVPFDAALAERELAAWRAQAPFAPEAGAAASGDGSAAESGTGGTRGPSPGAEATDWFARRLAADGIELAELQRVLGEPAEGAAARLGALGGDPPAWMRAFEEAFAAAPEPDAPGFEPALPVPTELADATTVGFLAAVDPLVRRARARLVAGARALKARHPAAWSAGGGPFEPETLPAIVLPGLAFGLHAMLVRALVLELHVARERGELAGATREERFASFLARLWRPGIARAALLEVPVLARAATLAVERWAGFALEVLGHLCAEHAELRAAFFGGRDPGSLTRWSAGAGDAHRGGRSVVILGFAGGERLVYKPRSLAVDAHFAELVAWLNARGGHAGLRAPVVRDGGDHGWCEFVEARPCDDVAEVRRFYRRQGGWLALLYLLEATDYHFENLVAAGEHPVLVDLETLFHPARELENDVQPDQRLVNAATSSSVLRSGLLPQRSWAAPEHAGVDISGLGMVAGQMTPDRVLQWEGLGTDEMRAERRRVVMPGGENLPRLGEALEGPLAYAAELEAGFTEVYRALLGARAELARADGPLECFAGCEVRAVLRATRGYGVLQTEAWHPELLRDGLELERFLDRLWVGVPENEWLARVVPLEHRELLAGDVPLFTTRPESRDVAAAGGERVAGFWPRSGLELVRAKLARLSEDDLARQRWFVRASLATLSLAADDLHWPSYAPVATEALPPEAELEARWLAEAARVGERVADLALRDGRDVAWIGLAFDQRQWGLVPLQSDLYGGAAGVIHFLAQLGAATGEPRFEELARAALATLSRRLARGQDELRSVGAFNGQGGIAWVLGHCACLWDDAELWSAALDAAARIDELLDADLDLDVIGGAAGAAAALLALHAARPDERLLAVARRAAAHVVERARPMPTGVGWFTRIETDEPITGFSHGGAGIAWALARAYEATDEERFRETARAGIRYETTQYVAGSGNWRDATNPARQGQPAARETALSMAWCYGAPGIGLARLGALRALDEPEVRADLEAALATTLAQGFGRNHSLCHGDLGNADVVLQAGRALDRPELVAAARAAGARALASIARDGWLCGVPLGVESPALMNGLAGIGYGLLRLARPERVPSVLSLEAPPPRRRGSGVE